MPRTPLMIAIVASLLVSSPGDAGAKGTHFLVEGQVTGLVTDTTNFGQSTTMVLGVGGKFKSIPLFRFYLLGQVSYDWFNTSRTRVAANAQTHQDDVIYGFGPRLYLSFSNRARVYFDLLFGGYWGRSEWTLNGMETYSSVDQGFAFVAGLGFQYRILQALSLGLRFDRCEFAGRLNRRNTAAFLGFPENHAEALLARLRFGLTLTAHF